MTSEQNKAAAAAAPHHKLQQHRSLTSSTAEGVTVETLEKGFLINVVCDKNCPGLLVSVLQAFEGLGLDVMDATVSCDDSFRLEAVGGQLPQDESVDAQMVRHAVAQAIKKCMGRGAN